MENNSVLKDVKRVFKKDKKFLIGLIVVILAVVFISLAPPQLLRIIVDNHLTVSNMDGLLSLALIYVLVLILIGICDFFKGFIITVVGQRVIKNIRMSMMEKLGKIKVGYFTNHACGEVTSHFTADVENINTLFSSGIVSMAIDCLKIVGIVASIWMFSGRLALIVLLVIPAVLLITRSFQKRMLKAQIRNLEEISKVNNHISESLFNVEMIKLYNKEEYMEDIYCKRISSNYMTMQKSNFYDSCYAPVIQVMRSIIIVTIVLLASDYVDFLGLSVGMVAASLDLVSNLLHPVESLGMELQNIQRGLSGAKRINSFYALEEDKKDEKIDVDKMLEEGDFKITFSKLGFSYNEEQVVLDGLNLEILPKTNLSFAGRTGVGKTTLFNLIMGLIYPTHGRVLIGTVDACLIPDKDKRKIFGYVEQSFQFIEGTVAEQISLKDPSIKKEEIIEACTLVGLHESILKMEKGYDTKVEKGEDFSWGQRHLLSVARAMVKNPPILLLDEVTANLDGATEEKMIEVLNTVGKNRTILSVSHRFTSILKCDKLVVIENGKIMREGSLEELKKDYAWLDINNGEKKLEKERY